jgi:hypothetical protein
MMQAIQKVVISVWRRAANRSAMVNLKYCTVYLGKSQPWKSLQLIRNLSKAELLLLALALPCSFGRTRVSKFMLDWSKGATAVPFRIAVGLIMNNSLIEGVILTTYH